jgi:site-specific DNA-methyltransferase (adenine-specific)
VRKDLGDIDVLAHSIKTFGLIQPIVLARDLTLVAGGRRLTALKRLGFKTLHHGVDFIWQDERPSGITGELRARGMELEENIKRKSLAWHEEIASKKQLLNIMQSIYGVGKGFGVGKHSKSDGFSIRRLAEMLNEHVSTTARDLELADFVEVNPWLTTFANKTDAARKLDGLMHVAAQTVRAAHKSRSSSAVQAPQPSASKASGAVGVPTAPAVDSKSSPTPQVPVARWRLYQGPFQDNIWHVQSGEADLVLTDLPYVTGQTGALGTGPSALHSAGLAKGTFAPQSVPEQLCTLARESFRVLRPNSYMVIFYGATHHCLLFAALEAAGFDVDPIPFIWLRQRTGAPHSGLWRYDPAYDQAFVARKGRPHFVRPNQPNYMQFPSVSGANRLHAGQKPVEVMQKFIEDMTVRGAHVVDMFAGSGTTGEAALRTGREVTLFELEPANCVLIKARINAI